MNTLMMREPVYLILDRSGSGGEIMDWFILL